MVTRRKYSSDDSELLGEKPTSRWKPYAYTLLFLSFLSAVNYLLIPYLGYRATGFGFLVGVLPVAVGYGLGPALVFATFSALVWDYFFIPPQFTLNIQTSEDVMMNLTYFVIALVSGFSGSRIRKHEMLLKTRERHAKFLYQVEKRLADKDSLTGVIEETNSLLSSDFGLASTIMHGINGGLHSPADPSFRFQLSKDEIEHAKWAYRNEKRAGRGTQTFAESEYSFYPLRGNEGLAGVLVVSSDITKNSQLELILRELCTIIGVAIERETHRATTRRNALLEASEKLHQTLLNSVSHEFRTPLTTILGTVNHLSSEPLPPEARSFVQDLKASAERLNQTVTNLLDMSRISSGALRLNRNLIDLADFIRTCVGLADYVLEKRKVTLTEPKETMYVLGDEKVLETAFSNLLCNAARHSPSGTGIQIALRAGERTATVEITNEGTTVLSGDEETIFDKFYSNSGGAGLGLGLAIVREIIELHLGTVRAKAHNGLTTFTVLLPREELPDRLKEELRNQ